MDLPELIQQTYRQARALRACPLFTGDEQTLNEIIALFSSVQGMEFCLRHHFPSLSTLRAFAQYGDVRAHGIFIDQGHVTLTDVRRVILAGLTTANIYCNKLQSYNIYLLAGARAVVYAAGWAVVHIEAARGCSVIRNTTDHAIIV